MKLNTNLLLQKQHSNLDQASPDEKNIAQKKSINLIERYCLVRNTDSTERFFGHKLQNFLIVIRSFTQFLAVNLY